MEVQKDEHIIKNQLVFWILPSEPYGRNMATQSWQTDEKRQKEMLKVLIRIFILFETKAETVHVIQLLLVIQRHAWSRWEEDKWPMFDEMF